MRSIHSAVISAASTCGSGRSLTDTITGLRSPIKPRTACNVRGDGRWFVEVLCQNGLIYPYGGRTLLAYAKGGVVNRVAELPDLQPYQTDGKNRVFKFPVERLDEVAAILRPRKRRSVVLTPEQVEARRETLRLAREARKWGKSIFNARSVRIER
jgi:hypothetical protein